MLFKRFPRGKYDPGSLPSRRQREVYNPKGEYREKTQLLTVKYNKQGRFCFGVGIIDRGDGPAGERIELFDYTTKNIISIADTEKLINSTTPEVKHLPHDHRKWCVTNRDDRVYYSNDLLTVVQGVGNAKAALLASAGIVVADAKSKAVAKRAPPTKYLLDDDNPFRKNMDRKRTSSWRTPGWRPFKVSPPLRASSA